MVVKITDIEAKQELLETNFHQIFHISLTNPFIDSDIINEWYNELLSNNNQIDDEDIINYIKNIKTSTEDEYNFQQVGLCVKVIDGNTLVLDTGEYISIGGVKAPNVNTVEGQAVKTAVECVCLNKSIGIYTDSNASIITYNIDEEQQKGINLNKILIKEKMCQYSTTLSDTINNILESEPESDNKIADISEQTNQFVNVTIPLEKIYDKNNTYGLGALYQFFNKDFNNILITNIDDYSIIHKCEIYQDVLFIRLQSYVDTIALHILPKIYNTSDNLLLVRDVMDGWNKEYTNDYYNTYYKDGINLYFQMKYNKSGIIADRLDLYKPYNEFSSLIDSETMSYVLADDQTWGLEPYQKTYGEYSYDISPYNLRNVQINVGYKYNTSSSVNTVHYTGTKDITNEDYNDRRTLIDCNLDNFTLNDHKISNAIHKLQYKDNDIVFPEHISVLMNIGFINKTGLHSQNIGKLYHKTIKYYNDSMYSEEFDGEATKYMFAEYDGTYYISLNSDKDILSPKEEATLSAKIIDIYESPVQNQKISFYKNGQIIGSALSDQQGIVTMKYQGDGTNNTDTFVAQTVYHIPSNEINIINIRFDYDDLTVDKGKYTLTEGEGSAVFDDTGLTVQGTISSDTFWYSPDNYLPEEDYTVEIDYIDWGNSQFASDFGIEGMFLGVQPSRRILSIYKWNGSQWISIEDIFNVNFVKGKTFKLKVTGTSSKTVKVYYDGTLLTTVTSIAQTRKQFFKTYNNRMTKFKNLKIY